MSWDPGAEVVRAIADYQRPVRDGFDLLRRKAAVIRHRFWQAVAGCDVPLNSRVRPCLKLPHPTGVVVHPDARIGANVKLFQGSTVGMSREGSGVPTIGSNVEVGCGAKVLGEVSVGDGARIGANAVVLQDVPAGAVAVGIPAVVHIIRISEESAADGQVDGHVPNGGRR